MGGNLEKAINKRQIIGRNAKKCTFLQTSVDKIHFF